MVDAIGIRRLKANFSKLVREAEQGKQYLVTRDGKPVAKLVPFDFERKKKPTR